MYEHCYWGGGENGVLCKKRNMYLVILLFDSSDLYAEEMDLGGAIVKYPALSE